MSTLRLSRRQLLGSGAAAVAAVGLAPLLAACGQAAAPAAAPTAAPAAAPQAAAAPSAGPVTFEIWHYTTFAPRGDAEEKRQIEEWAKSKGNVTLNYLDDNYDNITKRETVSVAAGAYPDVMDVEDATYRQFLESGAYTDVTGFYDQIGKQYDGGWLKNFNKIARVSRKNNTVWALPYNGGTNVVMYRGDVAADKKLPLWETWDDMYKIAKQAANPPDLYGTGIQLSWTGDAEGWWEQVIIAYGGHLTDETGDKLTIKSPETLEGLTWIKKTYTDKSINSYPPGIFQWDDASDNTCYQERHCFLIINPASVLIWMENNDQDLLQKTLTTRCPFASKTKQIYNDITGLNDAWVICNTKQTQTMDLAHDLMVYLFKPENYEKMINIHMELPTLDSKNLDNLPRWKDARHKALFDLNKTAIWTGWPAELNTPAGEFYNQNPTAFLTTRMVQQDWTPEKALDEYYDRAKTIWEKDGFKQ